MKKDLNCAIAPPAALDELVFAQAQAEFQSAHKRAQEELGGKSPETVVNPTVQLPLAERMAFGTGLALPGGQVLYWAARMWFLP